MANRPLLQRGSKGPDVVKLQKLLNEEMDPSPNLVTDGDFGSRTEAAVIAYQDENWLVIDGLVGRCTWNALLGEESYNLHYDTDLIGQPTTTTCWKAATAMLLARSILTISNGPAALMANGSLDNSTANMEVYARYHHLQLQYGASWLPEGLARLMQDHGRLMFHIIWNVYAWNPALPASGHMVVLAHLRGDGTAEGTSMTFLDPWSNPLGTGDEQRMTYANLLTRIPGATANLLYR